MLFRSIFNQDENRTIYKNKKREKTKTALSGVTKTKTGTLTHKTQHKTGYLNMVPNQRQRLTPASENHIRTNIETGKLDTRSGQHLRVGGLEDCIQGSLFKN